MKKRVRLAALLLSAAMLSGLAACGDEGQAPPASPSPSVPAEEPQEAEPAVLSLGYTSADSLHPLKARDQSNLDVLSLVYEGLYALDEAFEPQPVLADSASVSADGLTWTITLRENAVFSDGTPVTASDVVSSLRLAQKGGAYAARLAGILSIREKNGAVVIALSQPNGALDALLDVPVVLETGEDLPLGTGPYVFSSDGDQLCLVENPLWWQGRHPLYDSIPLHETPALEDRVSAFDSGDVTAVTTDFTASGALGYSGTYETHDFSTTGMLFVGFNAARGACSTGKVRSALSRCFDRSYIAEVLLSEHGDPAALPIHPASSRYSEEAAALLDYDTGRALALLEEAGYQKNDEGLLTRGRKALTLTLIVNRESLLKQRIAEYIADTLRGFGVTVTLETLDWDDYTAALSAGNFDLYLGETRLTGDFDPTALTFGALNYGGYWSQTVWDCLQTWSVSSGAARDAAAEALYLAMAEDPPFAVLCFKRGSLLARWGLAEGLDPLREAPFHGIENWTRTR